ncbi:MAG TPA: hypothetical protein VH020_13880 [Stellaceae bacterium]|nr:hypothetical protein [Stellaceae bacterium]
MERQELSGLIDHTLDAMIHRDPARAPLTSSVRYTENGQTLAIGKGLWATATSGGSGRRAVLADTAAARAGWFGTIEENGNPIVLALRIAEADGAVSEIETVVCRGHERIFDPDGMRTTRLAFDSVAPPSQRASRQMLVAAADAYFDGIEQSDGDIIPAAENCARVENGVQTTLNAEIGGRPGFPLWGMPVAAQISTGYYAYIEAIRDRRYPVIDEEHGLIMGVVAFDHPATMKSVHVKGRGAIELPAFTQKPSTALIAELFQVRAGKITGIEAVLDFFPYGMKPGW